MSDQTQQKSQKSPAEVKAEQERQIALREQRRQELEQTSFATNSQGGALMQPRNGKELMDMANLMSGSGNMVRDFYRGNPGDCAALIMICQPYGFNPFMVSWKTYKASKSADAPISFEGQLVNAMVNQSAPIQGRLKYEYVGEGNTRRCTVYGYDRETGEAITYTTPEIAKIPTKNSPLWKGDPDQQLGYYAARSWARRHFPELLLGVYTREEIEEAPREPRDITPKPGGFASIAQKARQQAAQEAAPEQEAKEDTHTLDGEVLPSEEGNAPAENQGSESGGAIERTFEFDEGATAFRKGEMASDCPYEGGDQLRDWRAGWSHAYDLANQQEEDDQ